MTVSTSAATQRTKAAVAARSDDQDVISQGLPLLLAGQDQFYGGPGQVVTYDLALPQRAPRHPVANKTWFGADREFYIGFDTMFGSPGMVLDYDLPKAMPRSRCRGAVHVNMGEPFLQGQDQLYGDPGMVGEYDLPNARPAAKASVESRSWGLTAVRFVGLDTFFGEQGQSPVFDLNTTAKRRPNPSPEVRTSAFTGFWTTLAGVVVEQVMYGDPGQVPVYQLPPATRARIAAQSWAITGEPFLQGQDAFYGTAGQAPAYDLPRANPLARNRPRTHIQTGEPFLIGQDRFYGDAGQSPTRDLPGARALNRANNRTDINTGEPFLIGQDSIYAGPGQVPSYELPRARQPQRVTSFFINLGEPFLIGWDTMFAAPGQVPVYTLPKGLPSRLVAREMRTWAASGFLWTINVPPGVMYGAAGQVPVYELPRGMAAKVSTVAGRTWVMVTFAPNWILPPVVVNVGPEIGSAEMAGWVPAGSGSMLIIPGGSAAYDRPQAGSGEQHRP